MCFEEKVCVRKGRVSVLRRSVRKKRGMGGVIGPSHCLCTCLSTWVDKASFFLLPFVSCSWLFYVYGWLFYIYAKVFWHADFLSHIKLYKGKPQGSWPISIERCTSSPRQWEVTPLSFVWSLNSLPRQCQHWSGLDITKPCSWHLCGGKRPRCYGWRNRYFLLNP